MDTSIRNLLANAKAHTGPPPNTALQQVYQLLRSVAETKPAVDVPESFSPDLYVQCAETAFQFGENEIARECLKMYFMKPPPQNQFLCRAYLCQAQLLAPRDANNPDQLEKAVVYLLKAISFAKNITRYHFLVYNASVLFWQFCRPFLKPNYRQFLARSLHQVVKALDDIDDKEYEWRAQLMLALIECHLDAGRRSDASHIAAAASGFIKQHVPHLYKQLFGLVVRHQLMETAKLHKDLKTVPELAVYYKILKIKVALSNGENRDFYHDIQNILGQVGQPAVSGDKGKSTDRLSRTESRASGRPASPPVSSNSRTTEEPDSAREGRELTRDLSRDGQRKASPSKAGRRTPTPTSNKRLQQDSEDRPHLLMELARLCIELDFPDLVKECVDTMKRLNLKDQGYFLELEFLQCALTMKNLRHRQESYQSNVVELRLHAIKHCEETIMNAIRHGDPNIIQVGCVTLWNLCLPLLQPNLRRRVRKSLTVIAEALEDIQSLLIQLRCQVHMELAKCEEDEEQIQVAMEHLCKAIGLDDGQVYQERLQVALHRLQLRSELYKTPERVEDQAGMIIEQARKADSGTMRMKRSLLVKAGEALAPDAFQLVLDSESDTKDAAGGKGPMTVIRQLAGKARQFTLCVKKAEGHLKRLGDENDCERARLWADLAKTARKQEVWDVCRVACRFCLLYDDGRWKYSPPSTKEKRKRSNSPGPTEESEIASASSDLEIEDMEEEEDVEEAEDMEEAENEQEAEDDQEKDEQEEEERDEEDVEETLETPKLDRTRTGEGQEGGGEVSSAQTPLTSSQVATPAQGDLEMKKSASRFATSRPLSPESANMNIKDLIRMLAEVNFINGEALVHLLRSEGVQLQNTPVPPEDKSKRPKGYVPKKADTDPDWIEYCDWIKHLSESATAAFLRGLALGVEIAEAWLVCCAAAYIWNYHNHVLAENRHREILDTLIAVLDGLKKVGHSGETTMLVHICNALATAYIQPWVPEPGKEVDRTQTSSPESTGKKGKNKDAGKNQVKGPVISPEALPDLKKAIEACEFAMQVTNGHNHLDVVPIAERMPVLQCWVKARQMAQLQIGKSFGAEDESSLEGQAPMTRAIVANEMLNLNKNGINEFRDAPTVKELANMIESCVWSDPFIELQMWTRLTYMAHDTKQHALVQRCSAQALKYATSSSQSMVRNKVDNFRHQYMVEQEMLSYASILLGQSLMDNMKGKNEIRREAMAAFLDSARYARNAGNYKMVMAAARHYWNACLPMIGQPIERELIKEPIRIILQCIKYTYDRPKSAKDMEQETGSLENLSSEKEDGQTKSSKKKGLMGNPSDDLSVWAALYGLLFQAFADQHQWQEALHEMDEAVDSMPRTKHRLIIFKHRVMVKAKLGLSVQMDIQKFRDLFEEDESEDFVAHMWRRIALSARQPSEQLSSYQYAIEALGSMSNELQKVKCLQEFGQWLYCNHFPLEDCLDQVEWGIDILLNQPADPANLTALQHVQAPPKELKKGAADKKRKPASSRKKGEDKSPKEEEGSKTPSTTKEEEINIADYIPIAKEADIGVLPNNPSLTLGDLCNVRQLDGLVQSHILMAELTGRGSSYHLDHLLQAYSYLMRIWQVSISASGPVMKELAKNPPPEAGNGKGSPKGKKKEKDAPPVKEKPKRKGPLDIVPATVEEWAVYDIPDEMIEAFKQESMDLTGINSHTFKKPPLTMHYLDELVKGLRLAGMSHLTFPVLAMQDLLSRTLLKSNALFMLVHLRAIEVCYELDQKNASLFHEKLIEVIKMDDDEVASSRAEIALWKEEQKQVADEEMKVRENLLKLAQEGSSEMRIKTHPHGTPHNAPEERLNDSHLGRVLSSIQTRYIWTDTAEVLIRLGYLQKAREFLNEALVSAEAFDDHSLRGRILYLLGMLALEERQFGQAVNFAREAQVSHNGDENFWFETTMLIANAAINNYENEQAKKSAKEVLAHALNEFSTLYNQRPNRMNFIGYVMAIIQAKLASTQADLILKESSNINKPKVMEKLLSACERFEQAANSLIQLGHLREAVPVLKEQAKVLRSMAHEAIEPEIRHTYFLQSLDVLREAVALARDINQNVLTALPLQDTKMLSMPTQRELVDAELECGWLLVEIMRERHAEMREQQREDQRKGSVCKMVEDLIRPTPDYTQMEREWLEIDSYAGEEALTHLYNAHSLAGNISRLKARAMINIGCCLKTVAMRQNPDPPAQWIAHELELLKMNTEAQGGDENETTTTTDMSKSLETITMEARQFAKYSEQIKNMKKQLGISKTFLMQAAECLMQGLNLSLQKRFVELCSKASFELVDMCGQFDPAVSSLLLALAQSCQASLSMEQLLLKAQPDPCTSQLAALLHQRCNFLANDISSNLSIGSVFTAVNDSLREDWQAWKRLEISPQHLDLLKEFPTNFNFVILQHSPDKRFLYGALLDRPKVTTGGGKGAKQAAQPVVNRSKVYGVEVDPRVLDDLVMRFKQHKQRVQQRLLKIEYQRTQAALRKKMLETLDLDIKQRSKTVLDDAEDEEAELEEEFKQLVATMDAYLKPIMTPIEAALRTSTSPTLPSASGVKEMHSAAAVGAPPPHEAVILLADPDLLHMPLEASDCLQSHDITSLSRDFSLQFFHHRFSQPDAPPPDDAAAKGKKGGKEEKPSRIPGLRDVKAKTAKASGKNKISLDRPLQPWQVPVDTANFRYIVDPHLDCPETEEHKPLELFNKVLTEYEAQFTMRWLGILGSDHEPSIGEWEIYMTESSSFIFYGTERLLSQIPPSRVSELNIPDCMILYLLDLVQTSKSFLRQSKSDVMKSKTLLMLEKPVETAMLVSLTGIKCLMANQWHCSLENNATKLNLTMKDLLEKGKTTGHTTRLLYSPQKRTAEEAVPEEEEQEVVSVNDKNKKRPSTGKASAAGSKRSDSPRGSRRGSRRGSDKPLDSDRSVKASSDPAEGSIAEEEQKASVEPEQPEERKREWFNMVCYGLPNLVVTQVGA